MLATNDALLQGNTEHFNKYSHTCAGHTRALMLRGSVVQNKYVGICVQSDALRSWALGTHNECVGRSAPGTTNTGMFLLPTRDGCICSSSVAYSGPIKP